MEKPVNRGALLLGLEPWIRVTTDADFRILEGGSALSPRLGDVWRGKDPA